jgi:two-component system, response regulator YesN
MLKVIIIDDEALVRVGLKSMINWEELGYEIVAEAANGQNGLDLIMKFRPDIVITDIKMPVMDGLEMMCSVLKANHKPKFVILSSYDEFQLVKQAMKLGAEEYLIKLDLEPEILLNTLTIIQEKILSEPGKTDEKERIEKGLPENISMLREGFLKRIISRPVQDQMKIDEQVVYLGIELNELNLACALVQINNIKILDKYDTNELRLLEVSFLNTINEIVNDIFKGYTFSWNQGEFVVVFSGDLELVADIYHEKAFNMAERLLQVLKQYFNIPVTIGISNLHRGYLELAQAYFESCQSVQHSFYSGLQPIVFFTEVSKTVGVQERIDITELRNILPKAIEMHDLEAIWTVFEGVISILDELKVSRGQALDVCFQIAYLICGVTDLDETVIKEITGYNNSLYESILTLNTLAEIINWLTGLGQGLCRFLSKNEELKNHRLIAKAKKYIMEHYVEEISLHEVAAVLNISSGYFSTIFKQYAGIGFTDYVTENKIEQAKKLLWEADYKIYEIANILGYQNAYYFSKVFKKITGLTPSEFAGKKH